MIFIYIHTHCIRYIVGIGTFNWSTVPACIANNRRTNWNDESLKIRERRAKKKKCRKWFLIGCRMNHRRWVMRVWRRTKYLKGCCRDSSEGLQFSRSKTDSRSNSSNFFPPLTTLAKIVLPLFTHVPTTVARMHDGYYVLLAKCIFRDQSSCTFTS